MTKKYKITNNKKDMSNANTVSARAVTIVAVLGCIWVIVSFVGWLIGGNSLPARQLREYNSAVEVYGADNIDTHQYTNGTKDFDCRYYSRAVKN